MGNAKFRGLLAPKPFWRFSKKICTTDYVVDPTPHAKIWVNRFKGGVSAHAWNCHPPASIFFSFLGSMRLATGRPVGPIVAVNGSNDALWWPLRPFYGFVNKKIIFQYFYPKMWKIALRPMGIWSAITLAPLKIRTICLHQTGGFRGRPI